MTRRFDIAVIGGGAGGLSVAAAAARFGETVVLFEKGRMGGDCLNTGCVPSKALLAVARQAQAMRLAARVGLAPVEPDIDFTAVQAHVRQVIAALAPHDSQERFEAMGVTVVRAAARFVDETTLAAAGHRYSARRIVIATGSRPAIPAIPGLSEVPHFTSETLFENAERPDHLVIIGAGPFGLEMAQAHRRLGSEVTVIEAGSPLGRDDPELSAVILERLVAEGVRVLSRTAIVRVSGTVGGLAIETVQHGVIAGSHLLVAAGRKPDLEGLDLEAGCVARSDSGVAVDRGLRSTTNRRVYAVGDAAGGLQFTHLAGHHAGLVIRQALFGLPVRADEVIPRVTYTDPELAQVGLTEAAARERHGDRVKVIRWPFRDNDRAVIETRSEGLMKVVTGSRGRILGVGIAGADAGELILPWVLAMSQGLKAEAMARLVAPYPTRSEASRRAAIAVHAGLASNPWLRRVIALVKRVRP